MVKHFEQECDREMTTDEKIMIKYGTLRATRILLIFVGNINERALTSHEYNKHQAIEHVNVKHNQQISTE